MQIQLSLAPEQFMWFLPDSSIHFSEENPGPVDIDFEKLPKDKQRLIILGIQKRSITCDVDVTKLVAIFQPSSLTSNVEKVFRPTEAPVKLAEENELLKQSPVAIKKALSKCVDLNKLRSMLELEKVGKNRKTVINSLVTRMGQIKDKMQVSVQSAIERATDPNAPAIYTNIGDTIDTLSASMEVSESEEETVTVEIPSD